LVQVAAYTLKQEALVISSIQFAIGRVRFVPEPHTKSIMVLAPPEFIDAIRELINTLDVPGKQVVIEAIVVEVEHTKVTSLGIELSTNPQAFGTLADDQWRHVAGTYDGKRLCLYIDGNLSNSKRIRGNVATDDSIVVRGL
jgi:hypothetical protein